MSELLLFSTVLSVRAVTVTSSVLAAEQSGPPSFPPQVTVSQSPSLPHSGVTTLPHSPPPTTIHLLPFSNSHTTLPPPILTMTGARHKSPPKKQDQDANLTKLLEEIRAEFSTKMSHFESLLKESQKEVADLKTAMEEKEREVINIKVRANDQEQ